MSKAKPGPPKNSSDFSSNWKKLQATLQPKAKKRKGEDSRGDHKRRKLGETRSPTADGKAARKFQGKSKSLKSAEAPKVETTKSPEKPDIWFDDVDEILLEKPLTSQQKDGKDVLVFDNAVTHATKAIAMDCEMVGVGESGTESILARVSLVNQHGHCIYDKFVKPREKVTDFRTHVSGVRPQNLKEGKAEDFMVVQKEVSDLLKGRILVGHALHNDLKVLYLDHPRRDIRDTSRYKPFRQVCGGGTPALKKLAASVLGVSVQQGEHSSVQDAQAAMRLYTMHRKRWEGDLKTHGTWKKKAQGKKKKKKEESSSTKQVTFANGS